MCVCVCVRACVCVYLCVCVFLSLFVQPAAAVYHTAKETREQTHAGINC